MLTPQAVSAAARSRRSASQAVEAYLQSLHCIRVSRALLDAPVWTANCPAGWQRRQEDEATRAATLV